MGILSGPAIAEAFRKGDIHINPWLPENLGPNSYDLRLSPELLVYVGNEKGHPVTRWEPLDVREKPHTSKVKIGDQGLVLLPDTLYLGSTIEQAGSDRYVPCIEGRSSMARLGISPHVSAGFGDHGFKRQWTLEITVAHPVRVYAGMRICQVAFYELIGDESPYRGKYAKSEGVVASLASQDTDL